MANNCLVTKLKSVVNNDTLIELGYVEVIAPEPLFDSFYNMGATDSEYKEASESLRFIAKTSDTEAEGFFSINDISQGQTVDSNSFITAYRWNRQYDSQFKVYIYDSTYIKGIINIDKMPMSENLRTIQLLGADMKDGSYKNSTGTIDNFSNKYKNLRFFACNYQPLTGDIATAFGTCIKSKYISVQGTGKIVGSIEAMAAAMVSNGRTSGTLEFTSGYTIKYQGVTLPDGTKKYITFNPNVENGYTVSDTNPNA
jgi:hypothetical protein